MMHSFLKYVFTPIIIITLTSSLSFAATITGKVIYEGEKPKLREIKMGADPVCLTQHTDKVLPQSIVLSENNEMKYAFLHIVQGVPKKPYPAPSEPLVLDQKGCMYNPAVFGVMVGQPVKILNPDGTLHNVHSLSKINPEFNLAMPKFRKETTKKFDKAEFMFIIKCDVHPWMMTYASVMEHPFFNVTNETGDYKIDNLPAGNYVLEAWHQRLASQKVTVTLAEGESKEVNFTFSRPDKK